MKKEPNATVGHIDCAFCGREVPVRRNKSGKLYWLCDFRRTGAGGCGLISPNLNDGQAWITARLRPVVEGDKPAAPVKEAAPPAAPVVTDPEAAPAPVKVKGAKPGPFAALINARIL